MCDLRYSSVYSIAYILVQKRRYTIHVHSVDVTEETMIKDGWDITIYDIYVKTGLCDHVLIGSSCIYFFIYLYTVVKIS